MRAEIGSDLRPESAGEVGVEETLLFVVADEPLPIAIIVADPVAVIAERRRVAPRITRKELVASDARHDDLDELADEPGRVIVRITLSDAQILNAPNELLQHFFHVARMQDALVVLRTKLVGHVLGLSAFVEVRLMGGGF